VIGNAMSRGNPEVEWLLDSGEIPFVSLPQIYHETILPGRIPVVITGTHGKTTTSTLTAFLLDQAGAQPGWMIGGMPLDLPSGSRLGAGAPFVIEGDEYDSAFFDKRSKFIHYRPRIAVLNNLEFDHADIFRDLPDIQRSFRHFLRLLPSGGKALVNGDDPNLAELLPVPWTQVVRVGTGPENDLVIRDFADGPEGARFDLVWQGKVWAGVNLKLHGLFNARNAAMAALAAAFATGLEDPTAFDLNALAAFRGVRRRQDLLHEDSRWTLLEDFAHHPTAVAGTLEALRAAHAGRRLFACFEPRSNTASTCRFQKEFTAAFRLADVAYLGAVHRAEKMAPEERLDTQRMAAELGAGGVEARAFADNADLAEALEAQFSRGEGGVIVLFSNGSFDGLPRRLVAALAPA